ncbi:tetratricopeptide repeat protein [Marinicella sediminis]|uniref:Tetratricopeptide repeat protein n=2 Tax=Marinicella sediminis TaxID=1792834 RepID=A0ABV7J929_9GAMM
MKIFYVVNFIVTTMFILSGCSNVQSSVDKDFSLEKSREMNQIGHEYSERSLHINALDAYEAAIKFDPSNAYAWYNKGHALDNLGEYKKALHAYEKAIKLSGQNKEIINRSLTSKCNTLMKLKWYTSALRTCNEALDIDPSSVESNYNKAVVLYLMNKKTESLSVHKTVTSLDSNYLNSWLSLATLYEEFDDESGAYEAYRKVSELDPLNSKAWYYQVVYLFEKNKLKESIPPIDNFVKLRPGSFEGWFIRGLVFHKLKQKQEALFSLEKAYSISNRNHNLIELLGSYYLEMEAFEKAWKLADDTIQLYPENHTILSIKYHYHLKNDEHEKAQQIMNKINLIESRQANK